MCLMTVRLITRDFIETVELELKTTPGWRGAGQSEAQLVRWSLWMEIKITKRKKRRRARR